MGDGFTSPQGRHAVDFFARKIRRLQPGSNPRSWVPEASMLTTRPPKPLIGLYTHIIDLINARKMELVKKVCFFFVGFLSFELLLLIQVCKIEFFEEWTVFE